MREWLQLRKDAAPSPNVELKHPRGSVLEGSLVVYADDTCVRRVREPGESWEKTAEGIWNDDCCYNQVVEAGGWKQNVGKADLAPGLLGAGFQPLVAALRVDEGVSKLAERVVPCARHLGAS